MPNAREVMTGWRGEMTGGLGQAETAGQGAIFIQASRTSHGNCTGTGFYGRKDAESPRCAARATQTG
jgi:hypothetical protein